MATQKFSVTVPMAREILAQVTKAGEALKELQVLLERAQKS